MKMNSIDFATGKHWFLKMRVKQWKEQQLKLCIEFCVQFHPLFVVDTREQFSNWSMCNRIYLLPNYLKMDRGVKKTTKIYGTKQNNCIWCESQLLLWKSFSSSSSSSSLLIHINSLSQLDKRRKFSIDLKSFVSHSRKMKTKKVEEEVKKRNKTSHTVSILCKT